MKKSTIGVLGIGEVGSAIAEIFLKKFNVLKKDLNFDGIKDSKLEVLHVCVPYGKKFQDIVTKQIKRCNPALVIIHSTVKPGTTSEIFKKTKTPIVHSPVMGTHPNLKKHILKFSKFIGPVNSEADKLAKKHFTDVGIKTLSFNNPLETETAKLLDSTYYAWNIAFNKLVAEMCTRLKLDFDNVYTEFNLAYNKGYKVSNPNVLRPVLQFKNGPIGGHCVIPNVNFLNEYHKSSLTSFILEANKKFVSSRKK